MKTVVVFSKLSRIGGGGLLATLLWMAVSSYADVRPTPYDGIVSRNAFALKPPPPPPDPAPPPPPPPPPTTVELTGIISIFGPPKVILEISPGPGKPIVKPSPLGVGERLDTVEIVSIDIDKNQATIRNSGFLTNLTFKLAKASGPAPGVPALPGAPGIVPPPPVPVPTGANAGNPGGGNGVMVLGGGGAVSPNVYGAQPQPVAATPAAGAPTGPTPFIPNNPNVYSGGFDANRSIPVRQIRTAEVQPQLSVEEHHLSMEETRRQFQDGAIKNKRGIPIETPPIPPTLLTPYLEAVRKANNN